MEPITDTSNKYCDIVMKGGITSGVVYPPVVQKLAEVWTFKNIGGTSAGAIAAAATAAAQYGKNRTGENKFAQLAELPQQLGERVGGKSDTRLFSLFQPQPQTKAIYDVLLAAVLGKGKWRRVASVAWVSARRFPLVTLFWLVAGVGLGRWVWLATNGGLRWYAVLSTLLLAVVGWLATLAWVFYRRAKRVIPGNYYGLCRGFAPEVGQQNPPLTTWLADLIDDLAGLPIEQPAGKPKKGRPLTFGDLWGLQPAPEAETENGEAAVDLGEAEHELPAAERVINLEMMTTNLTHGRPYRLPFEQRVFFFNPTEFRDLFPERVVEWMEKHSEEALTAVERSQAKRRRKRGNQLAEVAAPAAAEIANEDATELPDDEQAALPAKVREALLPLRTLPRAAHLPVIVATRMSLSFPVLLSAVPLYAIDFTRKEAKDRLPEPCWFSDGGICSNFPVHFFDQILPRHPTFAVNLGDFHPDRPEEEVFMPKTNSSGLNEAWTRFKREDDKLLPDFLSAIINTMQNWSDNTLTRLPGYRDRIVRINLDPQNEGGLNLNMPPELIAKLGGRGAQAAAELLRRYPGSALSAEAEKEIRMTWDNHRWVRYRSTLALLEKLLADLLAVHQNPLPGERSYAELLQRSSKEPPGSYRLEGGQKQLASEATAWLLRLAQDWQTRQQELGERASLQEEAPNPMPELRARPRI